MLDLGPGLIVSRFVVSFPTSDKYEPHEIESLPGGKVVDWGSEYGFVDFEGVNIFGNNAGLEIGFRSEGVIVWRYAKDGERHENR